MSSFVPLALAAGICRRVLGLQTHFSHKLFTQQMKGVTNKPSQKSCASSAVLSAFNRSEECKRNRYMNSMSLGLSSICNIEVLWVWDLMFLGGYFKICFVFLNVGFFCCFFVCLFKIIQIISKKFHNEPESRCAFLNQLKSKFCLRRALPYTLSLLPVLCVCLTCARAVTSSQKDGSASCLLTFKELYCSQGFVWLCSCQN